jgi:hypothetical protein
LQAKTILLAILLAESENELSVAGFLRSFQEAVGAAVDTLKKVPASGKTCIFTVAC